MIQILLSASILIAASAHANPSIRARCTGDGLTVELAYAPGPGGTDLAQLTVEDARGHATAWEAIGGHGHLDKMLKMGMTFETTREPKDQGLLVFQDPKAAWTQGGVSHALRCEAP